MSDAGARRFPFTKESSCTSTCLTNQRKHTKHSQWMKVLHVRANSSKSSEEVTNINFHILGLGNDFSAKTVNHEATALQQN